MRMYNLRARVRAAAVGAVRPPVEVRAQSLPTVAASQVTPSQALEILSEVSVVLETEVPFTGSQLIEEATLPPVLTYAPDMSFVSVRDTPVDLDESMYPLVPVAADSAAVQGPAVGTTPTRDLETVDMLNVDVDEMSQDPLSLKVDATPQKPTLTLTYTRIQCLKSAASRTYYVYKMTVKNGDLVDLPHSCSSTTVTIDNHGMEAINNNADLTVIGIVVRFPVSFS